MAEDNTYTPYTLADIERYLQGKMNAREMHDMEKAALQDPFLSDSIEGYSQASFSTSYTHLDEIAASLATEKQQAKVIAMPVKGGRIWRRLLIAASLAGAVIVSWVLLGRPGYTPHYAALQKLPALPKPGTGDSINSAVGDTKTIAKTIQPSEKQSITATGITGNKDAAIAQNQPTVVKAAPTEKESLLLPGADSIDGRTATANLATHPSTNELNITKSLDGPAANQANLQKTNMPVDGNSGYGLLDSTAVLNKTANAEALKKLNNHTASAKPAAPQKNINIKLVPVPGFDSTVTVTYLNNKNESRSIITDSSLFPQGGWETFRDYVSKQLHKEMDTTSEAYIEGDVELEFTVDDRGNARDIRVTRSLNRQSDTRAMDLVKKWPSWIATKKHKKGKVVIQF
ncbi:MAG TPA: energy transducer TonB [Chitinophagaceae bacterium]|nr:energy transducer TonB [Chitinophagaceae bacterium]